MESPIERRKAHAEEAISLATQLESSEDEGFIKENLPTFLRDIEEDLGIRLNNNVNEMYQHMRDHNCLARVESVSRVVKALEVGEEFEIGKGDFHYANAVIPETEGIKLAFSEGQAIGSLRTIIGFGKTLIGFKTDNIEVTEVDYEEDGLRDIAQRRYLCRHVDGKLSGQDIKTVVMRIPRRFVPETLMTDEEREDGRSFIFRGFNIE